VLICAGEQKGEKGRKEKKNLKERSVLLVFVCLCLLMGITCKKSEPCETKKKGNKCGPYP
jgi:hypothetical protein